MSCHTWIYHPEEPRTIPEMIAQLKAVFSESITSIELVQEQNPGQYRNLLREMKRHLKSLEKGTMRICTLMRLYEMYLKVDFNSKTGLFYKSGTHFHNDIIMVNDYPSDTLFTEDDLISFIEKRIRQQNPAVLPNELDYACTQFNLLMVKHPGSYISFG